VHSALVVVRTSLLMPTCWRLVRQMSEGLQSIRVQHGGPIVVHVGNDSWRTMAQHTGASTSSKRQHGSRSNGRCCAGRTWHSSSWVCSGKPDLTSVWLTMRLSAYELKAKGSVLTNSSRVTGRTWACSTVTKDTVSQLAYTVMRLWVLM
jgi:hypothetical protein